MLLLTADAGDFSHLRPMVTAAVSELEAAGIDDTPEVAVADAQYWNEQHMDDVISEHGIQVLIPPDSGKRKGERPGWTGGRYSFMRRVLASDFGRETYRKRQNRSSRCSVTPNTIVNSPAFTEEAD